MADDIQREYIYLKSCYAAQLRSLHDCLDILHDIQDRVSMLGYTPAAEDMARDEENALKTALLRFDV